jgi:hypothetical protein
MENEQHSNQIQVITEDGKLCEDFNNYVKTTEFGKVGKNYHIISIIGNQSTGKSTLLNRVFGTTFDVMDASRVRKQTTKGILVSKDQEKNILVFDVEGADSKERWDGHEPFEQCTALFSLVMSQVILVNIWTQEVGRFTGSNYGVLKVIFENNLKLFKQEGFKKLIFILRDYDDTENQDTIRNTIRQDIHKIWAEINKPKDLLASNPEQFFEFEFVFLTNYKWQRKVFEEQTNDLRNRFIEPEKSDYIFTHHSIDSNVPMDGLYLFMDNVWTTIKECKDINLPSQKTLVANLRCTDIKNEIIVSLQNKINNLKDKASKGFYADFGSEGEAILQEAFQAYDAQTENYEKTVVAEKRKELAGTLLQTFFEVYERQISQIRKTAVADLTSRLNEVKVNPDNIGNVMEKVKKAQNEVYETFQRSVQNVVIPSSDWNTEMVLSEVKQQMDETASMFREKQLAFILKQKSTQVRREIEGETVRLFNNLSNDFWTVLDNFYNETLRTTEGFIKNMLSDSFELNSDLIQTQVRNLNEDAYKDLESDLRNRFQELNHFMLKRFRNIFAKNENNVPINWKTLKPEEVEQKYIHAKKECNELIQNLKHFGIRKRGEDYLEKRSVLSEKEYENLTSRLNEDFEHEFREAERKRAASNVGAIPKWFWFVLLFFAYDNILNWISNPWILGFLIYPLFIIGCLVALAFATGNGAGISSMFSGILSLLRVILGPQLSKVGINL